MKHAKSGLNVIKKNNKTPKKISSSKEFDQEDFLENKNGHKLTNIKTYENRYNIIESPINTTKNKPNSKIFPINLSDKESVIKFSFGNKQQLARTSQIVNKINNYNEIKPNTKNKKYALKPKFNSGSAKNIYTSNISKKHKNINIKLNLNSEIINNNYKTQRKYLLTNNNQKCSSFYKLYSTSTYNNNISNKNSLTKIYNTNNNLIVDMNEKIKEKDLQITKLQKELLQSQELLSQLQKDKQKELNYTYFNISNNNNIYNYDSFSNFGDANYNNNYINIFNKKSKNQNNPKNISNLLTFNYITFRNFTNFISDINDENINQKNKFKSHNILSKTPKANYLKNNENYSSYFNNVPNIMKKYDSHSSSPKSSLYKHHITKNNLNHSELKSNIDYNNNEVINNCYSYNEFVSKCVNLKTRAQNILNKFIYIAKLFSKKS